MSGEHSDRGKTNPVHLPCSACGRQVTEKHHFDCPVGKNEVIAKVPSSPHERIRYCSRCNLSLGTLESEYTYYDKVTSQTYDGLCKKCYTAVTVAMEAFEPNEHTLLNTELQQAKQAAYDVVAHPSHYTGSVPNIECIDVAQHFNFNRGNAIKYLWRAGLKGDEVEDLRKARQYIDFEIARLEAK